MSTALDTDTGTLEGLDFSADLPCEARTHAARPCGVKALWVLRVTCCDRSLLVCDNKRQSLKERAMYLCPESYGGCGGVFPVDKLVFDPIPEVWHAA